MQEYPSRGPFELGPGYGSIAAMKTFMKTLWLVVVFCITGGCAVPRRPDSDEPYLRLPSELRGSKKGLEQQPSWGEHPGKKDVAHIATAKPRDR